MASLRLGFLFLDADIDDDTESGAFPVKKGVLC
jgi:hypothetical protein